MIETIEERIERKLDGLLEWKKKASNKFKGYTNSIGTLQRELKFRVYKAHPIVLFTVPHQMSQSALADQIKAWKSSSINDEYHLMVMRGDAYDVRVLYATDISPTELSGMIEDIKAEWANCVAK